MDGWSQQTVRDGWMLPELTAALLQCIKWMNGHSRQQGTGVQGPQKTASAVAWATTRDSKRHDEGKLRTQQGLECKGA
eukprot:1146100-Pelagomonas_calceolata.AAC.2